MTGAKLPRALAIVGALTVLTSAAALALDPPREAPVPVVPPAPQRPLATTPEPARPAASQPGTNASPTAPQTPRRSIVTTPEPARPAASQPGPAAAPQTPRGPVAATPETTRPSAGQPVTAAAVGTHARTGLVFPPRIAATSMIRFTDHAQRTGRPGLGQSWDYQNANLPSARISVYDLDRRVPDGSHDPMVLAEFETAMRVITTGWTAGGLFRDIVVARPPDNCPVGSVVFRCATLSVVHVKTGTRFHTQVLLTGYGQHFLKVQPSWQEGSVAGQAEVDRFVQIVVGAILR